MLNIYHLQKNPLGENFNGRIAHMVRSVFWLLLASLCFGMGSAKAAELTPWTDLINIPDYRQYVLDRMNPASSAYVPGSTSILTFTRTSTPYKVATTTFHIDEAQCEFRYYLKKIPTIMGLYNYVSTSNYNASVNQDVVSVNKSLVIIKTPLTSNTLAAYISNPNSWNNPILLSTTPISIPVGTILLDGEKIKYDKTKDGKVLLTPPNTSGYITDARGEYLRMTNVPTASQRIRRQVAEIKLIGIGAVAPDIALPNVKGFQIQVRCPNISDVVTTVDPNP